MIKFHFKWILTQVKLNLRSVSFYIMVILLALGFFLTDSVIHEYTDCVEVLVISDGSEFADDCIRDFCRNRYDGFCFEIEDNPEIAKEKVKRGDVSCAVFISEDEDEPVRMISQAGTIDSYVVKELLFPVILKASAKDWIDKYLYKIGRREGNGFPDEETVSYVHSRFADYLNMNFRIYELVEQKNSSLNKQTDSSLKLRRLIYFVIIFSATVVCIYDTIGCDRAFYMCFSREQMRLLKIEKIVVFMLMSVLIAYVMKNCMNLF